MAVRKAPLILAVAAGLGIAWLRRTWTVITIAGSSMEPTYHEGDRVLVRRTRFLSTGQIAVVERPTDEPGRQWIIKRVSAVPGEPVPDGIPVPDTIVPEGNLVLLGDNPGASFDSRMVGYFRADLVLGGVVRRMGGRPEQV